MPQLRRIMRRRYGISQAVFGQGNRDIGSCPARRAFAACCHLESVLRLRFYFVYRLIVLIGNGCLATVKGTLLYQVLKLFCRVLSELDGLTRGPTLKYVFADDHEARILVVSDLRIEGDVG